MLIKKVHYALALKEATWILKEPIEVLAQASYSPILTLAAFMVFHHSEIPPHSYSGKLSQRNIPDTEYPGEQLSFNYYFQLWCDHLSTLLETGFGYKDEDVLYFIDKVENNYWIEKKLKQDHFVHQQPLEKQNMPRQQLFETIFGVKYSIKGKQKKIGIANFSTSQLRSDFFRPKVNLRGLIQGAWFGNHHWSHYKILKGQFPTKEQFAQMDVLVLTGSNLSINDNDPEVQKFIPVVKEAIASNKSLKIVGFCFGHQFLTKAYNGKVVKKEKFAGIQKVKFDEKLLDKYEFLSVIKYFPLDYLALSQYHSDYIGTHPDIFIPLASSPSCENEAMISEDGRMISFQFHPEYSTEYTKGYELRVANYQVEDTLKDFCGTGKPNQEHVDSINCIRVAIMNFIDQ